LLQVLRNNLSRRSERVRVFEIGRVFMRNSQAIAGERSVAGLDQPQRVAGLIFGSALPTQWGERDRAVDFFDLKGDLQALLAPRQPQFEAPPQADLHPALHPGRSARVMLQGQVIGHLGELHPRWVQSYELPQAPLLFELDLDRVLQVPVPMYQPIARQQAVKRDLALVVNASVRHDALLQHLKADPEQLVRDAVLFDIYQPSQPGTGMAAGERSMAVRLSLLDEQATLTEARIETAMAAALQRASQAFGARLRG
jgi:phenylalanyl-tRNA synthetase beta chain